MKIVFLLFLLPLCFACSTPHKPCTWGGQDPRDVPSKFEGRKTCEQAVDLDGKVKNHGKYREWDSSDRIAIEGEYNMGKKTGRWIEYNSDHSTKSDRYFLDGKEVPRP